MNSTPSSRVIASRVVKKILSLIGQPKKSRSVNMGNTHWVCSDMHGIVCNCAVLNVIASYCMVASCIGTVIVILNDWCGIGVVHSENLKKLPASPAGSILAHYGVESSCRS